ncbi:MAG: hypothetical protein RIT27_861 [Pseudomonadota bacterium]|jgi:carbonic anhydrase
MKIWHSVVLSFAISQCVCADEAVHWSYEGVGNPSQWGKLKPEFVMCEIGKNQTPINLIESDMIEAELSPLQFIYQNAISSVINNGHTIQVDYPQGSTITVDAKTFKLVQFHFHAPSENQINGKTFPLELHLVHKDDNGALAVIGVMFDVGNENSLIDTIWKSVSEKPNESVKLSQEINPLNLLPEIKDYFRFNGSLTTPPCSEGVRWFVMKKPLTVSPAQVQQFKGWIKHDNARPLQTINARPILK